MGMFYRNLLTKNTAMGGEGEKEKQENTVKTVNAKRSDEDSDGGKKRSRKIPPKNT